MPDQRTVGTAEIRRRSTEDLSAISKVIRETLLFLHYLTASQFVQDLPGSLFRGPLETQAISSGGLDV